MESLHELKKAMGLKKRKLVAAREMDTKILNIWSKILADFLSYFIARMTMTDS